MLNERDLRMVLSENELRLTSERKAILEVLSDLSAGHPTAEEVYLAAREEHPGVGLATVYRTLDLFTRLGIASKNDLGGSSARYELKFHERALSGEGEEHSHHHLVCVRCGRIVSFREDLLNSIEKEVRDKTGFEIQDHDLKFYGVCPECRRRS